MKKYNCFSLVEILTVIVIASILFAIALPAVSSMIRGNAATQAGRELMGRIKAARAYAVSKQTPVAIVLPTARAAEPTFSNTAVTPDALSAIASIPRLASEWSTAIVPKSSNSFNSSHRLSFGK